MQYGAIGYRQVPFLWVWCHFATQNGTPLNGAVYFASKSNKYQLSLVDPRDGIVL